MVSTSDLKFYKSATNGLGGAINLNAQVATNTTNGLFGNVDQAHQVSGGDSYNLVYIKNTHASETMKAMTLWLTVDSGLGYEDSSVKWGKGTTGKNGIEQTIPDSVTEPTGITWTGVSNFEPLTRNIGDLASGDFFPIWIWRHMEPNSTARRDDGPLFEFAFDITSTGTGSGGGTGGGVTMDKYGIKQFFPTKAGGLEWFNKWDNGNVRTLIPNRFDPDDARQGFQVTDGATPTMVINGDGTVTLPDDYSASPHSSHRIFVHGPWTNTEMTVYARFTGSLWSSFQLRSRADHHGTNSLPFGYDSVNDISCGFGNYIVKFGDDNISPNVAANQVEIIQDEYSDNLNQVAFTQPAINIWTGFKTITRTVGGTVNVQGYVNYSVTDQTAWTKVTEFTYSGTNVHIADDPIHDINITTCQDTNSPYYSTDRVADNLDASTLWLLPGYWCWIRKLGGFNTQLKWFSIREIEGQISGDTGGGGGNPPPIPTNWKMAVAGDWGCGSTTDNVHDLAKTYDYIIGVGDNAYAAASCWTSTFSDVKTKMVSAFGNHEYEESGGIGPYKTFFGYTNTYFSKDFQNVHILVLDTNISMASGSGQHTFAENDLNAASANSAIDWIFVTFHHPMFGASSQHSYNDADSVGNFMQLFQTHKVAFVFCGHNHNWQRTYQVTYNASSKTNPNVFASTSPYTAGSGGLIHVVSGTGGHDSGSSLYSLGSQPAFQAYQNRTNNGIFEIVASNNGQTLTCSFVNINGSKFDTFVINSA